MEDAQLQMIHCLRDFYLEHGLANNGRELGDMLDKAFSSQCVRQYLHRLLPGGPVIQGSPPTRKRKFMAHA